MAVSFNGAGDRLAQNDATVPASSSSYTVTGWIKVRSGSNGTVGMPFDPCVIFESDNSGQATFFGLHNGLMSWWTNFYDPIQNTVGSAITPEQWYFFGARINGTASSLSIGDESTAATHSSATVTTPTTLFRFSVMGSANYDFQFPDADAAYFRVWNAVLSDAEIEAERLSETPVRTSNLAADWRFTNAASRLTDSSGNGKTLSEPGSGSWSDATGPSLGIAEVTGTIAATLAAPTMDAEGTSDAEIPEVTGTIDSSVAPPTMAASGFLGAGPLDWKSTLMPLISRGKPIYGTGVPAQMNDGKYGYVDGSDPGAWACSNGSWVAINVGAGPSSVLIALSDDTAGDVGYTSTELPGYRLQVSADSTNGADGTWTTVVTETTNPSTNREYKVDFVGQSWVKLIVDSNTSGQMDELNVWDASAGTPDTFVFVGDSITDASMGRFFYFGGGELPSFQENVEINQPGHYPLQANAGISSIGAEYWAANIDALLALHPEIKYWCITIGTNDGASMPGAISDWRTDMTTVINAITTAGKTPIIARVPYTGAAGYGGSGSFEGNGLKYLNDEGVDWIVSNLGVRPGPDLYQLFWDNRTEYAVGSDPHPNETGRKGWTKAWADSLGIGDPDERYGNTNVSVARPTMDASGTVAEASITGTIASTLTAPTMDAAGTVVAPEFTGTIAATLQAPTMDAEGASFPPGISGGIEATLTAPTMAASGTVVAPAVTGTISSTIQAPTMSAAGTAFPPPVTGTVAATLIAPTMSAAGTSFPPGISGGIAATLPSPTMTASGTAFPPAITGTISASTTSPTMSAAGTVVLPTITGTISSSIQPPAMAATGESQTAGNAGSISATLPRPTMAASGTVTIPPITGTIASTVVRPAMSAAGSTGAPISGVVSAVLLPALMSAVGFVVNPPPPPRTTSMSLPINTAKRLVLAFASKAAGDDIADAINSGANLAGQSSHSIAAFIVATATSATTDFGVLAVGDRVIIVPASAGNAQFVTCAVAGTLPQAAVIGSAYIVLRARALPEPSDVRL